MGELLTYMAGGVFLYGLMYRTEELDLIKLSVCVIIWPFAIIYALGVHIGNKGRKPQ